MSRGYRVLSLFGGIETGYAALKDAGVPIECYYSSEIDKNAIKAAKWNYPQIVHIGDVKDVVAANLPFVPDLLIGGFPCQDLSFAGLGAGLDGEKSGLFYEAVRILRECQAINPNVLFLFENVPMAKKWEYKISEILGLDPWKNCASLVSAQTRKRLWWSNIRTRTGFWGDVTTDFPQPEDQGIMLADILEEVVDKKYLVSETALARFARFARSAYSKPRIDPEKSGTILTKNNSGQLSGDSGTTLIGVVNDSGTLRQVEKSNCIDANFHKGIDNHGQRTFAVVVRKKGGSARKNHDKTSCFTAGGNSGSEGPRLRRLTPVEVCRLFTLPDDFFQTPAGPIIAETNQYKALGNGWVKKVVVHICSFLPQLPE